MAVGDLILSSGFTLTPEDLRVIAAESKKILAEESKDLSQYKEIDSISSVSSLPGISAQKELVRVPMAILKGLDGREIELASSSTVIQWRYVGNTGWNVLVELSLLSGPKGNPGDPPVISIGTVSTLPFNSSATADLALKGETPEGIPIYALDLGIPQGKPGQDGNGAGNVFVSTDNILADRYYIFKSSADKSVNGDFIELNSLAFGVGQNYPGYKNAEIFNDYENNKAAGAYAHAEGRETNATGPRAHAEGYKTSVFAADAHAEGRETWCLGPYGHVEGMNGIAWGGLSHVEGLAAHIENGYYDSPVEGGKTILNEEKLIRTIWDTYGLVQDYSIIVSENLLNDYYIHGSFGERNHVEGVNNVVFNNCVHVEGRGNVSGNSVTAHGAGQIDHVIHMEGCWNTVYPNHMDTGIHIEGKSNIVRESVDGSTISYATAAHVEGENNIIDCLSHIGDDYIRGNARWSHVGGYSCSVVRASYAFAHGDHLFVSNDHEVSFGRYNLSELNGNKVLFSYGIGDNELRRENALSILEDGTVVIPRLDGGGVKEQIEAAIRPLINNVNKLNEIIDEQSKQIQDLLALITSVKVENDILMIGTPKAFMIGSVLVLTRSLPAGVSDDTLTITDTSVEVENGILTIK